MLRFKANGETKGTFAIDDIKLRPGKCSHLDDYVYTFDSFDDLEMYRMKPLASKMGVLYSKETKFLYPNAPTNDHTTGDGSYLLLMNVANDLQTIYVNWLVINNLPQISSEACVRFSFQVYGNVTLAVAVIPVESNSIREYSFISSA